MNFNSHHDLVGKHAFLSASKYSWLNYDEESLQESFTKARAAQLGTELHEVAAKLIDLGINLQKSQKTLNLYVNDAIGFRMSPEVVLFYSFNIFGTADAISYRMDKKTKRMKLRIHDLKTGANRTSEKQLMIYAALFCLEYGVKPHEIDIELRIYQNNFMMPIEPDPDDIILIMDKIVHFDQRIEQMKAEERA